MRACSKLNYAHDEEDLVEMTNATEEIWWNNFWYLYPDINFVIDGTKWDFFRAKDDCHRTR